MANATSVWTINYIKFCLLRNDVELIVFTEDYNPDVEEFYKENGIKVITHSSSEKAEMKSLFVLKRIPIRRKYVRILNQYAPFDIINLQFVTYGLAQMALRLAVPKTRLIFSYWGSDLLRIRKVVFFGMHKVIPHVQYVTFASLNLQERFEKLYGGGFHGKATCAYFGLPILDVLDGYMKSGDSRKWKNVLGIDENKIAIAIGCNGTKAQQHLKVLEIFKGFPDYLKGKIELILQMTYGGTESYRKEIIQKAENLGIAFKVFCEFMQDEDIAALRMATDIYINAQTTDALSGSIRENLYCGKILFNAEWLRYRELEENKIEYLEFKDFIELGKILQSYLEQKIEIDTSLNKERIGKQYSWENCQKQWARILYR